jgi:hypothetical protein
VSLIFLSSLSSLSSLSCLSLQVDFNQKSTWQQSLKEHFPLEGGRVVEKKGYKKFSVGQLFNKLKELDPRVPYEGSFKGGSNVVPWREPAYEAVAAHFGIIKLHDNKHDGLGKCIPDWDRSWSIEADATVRRQHQSVTALGRHTTTVLPCAGETQGPQRESKSHGDGGREPPRVGAAQRDRHVRGDQDEASQHSGTVPKLLSEAGNLFTLGDGDPVTRLSTLYDSVFSVSAPSQSQCHTRLAVSLRHSLCHPQVTPSSHTLPAPNTDEKQVRISQWISLVSLSSLSRLSLVSLSSLSFFYLFPLPFSPLIAQGGGRVLRVKTRLHPVACLSSLSRVSLISRL